MKIHGSVALVTGANRGLGREFARELVSRGAAEACAAARNPAAVTGHLSGRRTMMADLAAPSDD